MSKPLVLVSACNRMLGAHEVHFAGRKYVDAARLAGALPLLLPPIEPEDMATALDAVDGVLLTGSPSNVDPRHFGETVRHPSLPLDAARDATTLPLIRQALERGVPLFAICRGFQEMNVALGGSLHQAVQDVPGLADHRDDATATLDVAYGPAHRVDIEAGGLLAQLVAELLFPVNAFQVNSLHGQGVNRLAPGLRSEARAPDGLIEAFSMPGTPAFNLGVQWHPEWQAASNPVSMRLLAAFGAACVKRQLQRQQERHDPRRY